MLAYQLNARFKAGLILSGKGEDGELEFMGTKREWQLADLNEQSYELSIQ